MIAGDANRKAARIAELEALLADRTAEKERLAAEVAKEEAAIRELREETSLRPLKVFIADHVSSFYEKHDDRLNLVPVFGIEVDFQEVVLSKEHCDFKWVKLDVALSHLVWNGQKRGIQVVNDMVISNDDRMKWSQIKIPDKLP